MAALCAGYGGLELGLGLAAETELSWVSEIDPDASTVLEHRFAVPNLGDLTAITDPPPVDIITAGFPCQPVSTAGLRKGTADERWLIDDVCRVARAAEARWLVLENVRGILTANDGDAMAQVCAAMAREGFSRWEWCTVRASDVGAPHRRERWFCVAENADSEPRRQRRVATPGQTQSGRAWPDLGRRSRTPVADSDGEPARRHPGTAPGTESEHAGRATPNSDRPADGVTAVADSDGERLEKRRVSTGEGHQHVPDTAGCGRFGTYQAAINRWERILGRPAPDPLTNGRLNPRFVEWIMGLPDGWVTDLDLSRNAQLRILGNGVVPQQAAYAIKELTG